MKETFARSSVSCLTGGDLQSVTAVRGDPCWQVTQQLHLLIEKVTPPSRRLRLQLYGVWRTNRPLLVSVRGSVLMTRWLFGQKLTFLALKPLFLSLVCSGSKSPHPLEYRDIITPQYTLTYTLQLQQPTNDETCSLFALWETSVLPGWQIFNNEQKKSTVLINLERTSSLAIVLIADQLFQFAFSRAKTSRSETLSGELSAENHPNS